MSVCVQVGGSRDDLLQGVSPSSTIRDLEAACGPLSAASGLLDAPALPPAKDAAILPLLWARFMANLAYTSEHSSTVTCCFTLCIGTASVLCVPSAAVLSLVSVQSLQQTTLTLKSYQALVSAIFSLDTVSICMCCKL